MISGQEIPLVTKNDEAPFISISSVESEIESLPNSEGKSKDEFPEINLNKSQSVISMVHSSVLVSPETVTGATASLLLLMIGIGCFSLPCQIRIFSIVGFSVLIIFSGILTLVSFYCLIIVSSKLQINTYSGIVENLYGRKMAKFLDVNLLIDTFVALIIYQIVIYMLLGGVINRLFNLGYESDEDFNQNSFWGEKKTQIIVNCLMTLLIFVPIGLLKNLSQMRFVSIFGTATIFILIGILTFQSPWFIVHYFKNVYNPNDPQTHLNIFNVSEIFENKIQALEGITSLFFAYSCHVGVFPIINAVETKSIRIKKRIFRRGTIIGIVGFLISTIVGYLTQPIDTPTMIFGRKSIFKNDILMTLAKALFCVSIATKIPVNYNCIRAILLDFLGYDTDDFPFSLNVILTLTTLFSCTLFCCLSQNIIKYISLAGSFISPISSFLVPLLIYIKGNGEGFSLKNIGAFFLLMLPTVIGFAAGIINVYTIIHGNDDTE